VKDVPVAGSRGPRRRLTQDEEALVAMLDLARDALRRLTSAEREVALAKDAYARRCLDLHSAGLSLAQIATGLGVSRLEAQRLIARARGLET